jgi:hypothetical protein
MRDCAPEAGPGFRYAHPGYACCYWGTDITNSLAVATYRQRVTHFTEQLSFLSESDKEWVMGRAILARLKWA